MKRIAFLLAGLCLLVGLFATPVLAQEPILPHAFYGAVEINDGPASLGTTVEIRGEGVLTGVQGNPITVTEAGKYGGSGDTAPKIVVQGDVKEDAILTFYVNGVEAETEPVTVEWHRGEVTEVNLSAAIRGGGGGGGGGDDTTPPRISDIVHCHEGVTETTADICWATNEKSTSQVEYWASPGMLSPLDETLVIEHHVKLTGLAPCTTYHYQTMSRDASDNLAVSEEYTFTTLGDVPATAFTSSDLSISPSEVQIGETINISAQVTNTSNCPGSYTVTLKINGVEEATEDIILNGGASKVVTFTTAKDVAGSYSVDVSGLSGSFTVKEEVAPPTGPPEAAPPEVGPSINWLVSGGIIAAVLVVIVGLIIFFVFRRRAY